MSRQTRPIRQTTPTRQTRVSADYVGADQSEVAARHDATRLRNLLRLNSVFSTVTGVTGVVAAGTVAELLGVDQVWLVRTVAAVLLAFALAVFVVAASRTPVLSTLSRVISLNDLGWVAGTAVILALGWLSTGGIVAMSFVGVIVLCLGLAQIRAGRRLVDSLSSTTAAMDESPPIEVVTFDRPAPIGSADLWPVMTDHELYAALALNLRAAEGLTPNGPGFRRTCTDSAGRMWSETCTLWEPGRRFDVNVDTEDYPYPLAVMQGSWRVRDLEGEPGSSVVGMTFAFQPAKGPYGAIFVPLMHLTFAPVLKRIAKGWISAAESARAESPKN